MTPFMTRATIIFGLALAGCGGGDDDASKPAGDRAATETTPPATTPAPAPRDDERTGLESRTERDGSRRAAPSRKPAREPKASRDRAERRAGLPPMARARRPRRGTRRGTPPRPTGKVLPAPPSAQAELKRCLRTARGTTMQRLERCLGLTPTELRRMIRQGQRRRDGG